MAEMLTITVEDAAIVIRLPLETMRVAAENCEGLATFNGSRNDFRKVRVTHLDIFAKEVVRELNREEEDGTTPVHLLFDAAFENAVEQGAEGIYIEGIDGMDEANG